MENDEEVELGLQKSKTSRLKDEEDPESDSDDTESVRVSVPDESVSYEVSDVNENGSDGEAVEPFNLDQEREEGEISNGEYVKTDHGDQFDSWLDGLDFKSICKARDAEAARQTEPAEKQLSEIEGLEQLGSLLKPGESAMEAIETSSDGTRVEGITVACSALLSTFPDVYDLNREELNRLFRSKSGRGFKRKRVCDNWKFKWPGQDAVHGPFTAMEMQAWLDHGYFTGGVLVSPFEEQDFQDVSKVTF